MLLTSCYWKVAIGTNYWLRRHQREATENKEVVEEKILRPWKDVFVRFFHDPECVPRTKRAKDVLSSKNVAEKTRGIVVLIYVFFKFSRIELHGGKFYFRIATRTSLNPKSQVII